MTEMQANLPVQVNSQLFHRNSQLTNRPLGDEFSNFHETLSYGVFPLDNTCGKKKNQKIWLVGVEKCYFVEINGKLIQLPDNDKAFRRIRGHFGCKRAVSSAGGVQKAAPGCRNSPLCY
ncbi:MAG: hypothetical protein JNN00_16690 [Chitinophagaceae bacterium]|nr:hypothetical protein [Chitinophagaceae bacterium]